LWTGGAFAGKYYLRGLQAADVPRFEYSKGPRGMGILLSKIRINNYRSIGAISLELGMFNLLIGQNNTGKTNFLRAINIAISGSTDVS
jgi:hypothetical protein